MIIIVEPGDDDLPPPDEMAEELMQLGYPVSEIRVRRGNRHTRTVWAIVDQVLVERVLAGERLPTNASERRVIIREALRRGIPLAQFERLGWRPERYMRDAA